MNIEELRNFCLSLKGAEESMPFDDKTLVFSVKGKMFCATDINTYEFVNLKCKITRCAWLLIVKIGHSRFLTTLSVFFPYIFLFL